MYVYIYIYVYMYTYVYVNFYLSVSSYTLTHTHTNTHALTLPKTLTEYVCTINFPGLFLKIFICDSGFFETQIPICFRAPS